MVESVWQAHGFIKWTIAYSPCSRGCWHYRKLLRKIVILQLLSKASIESFTSCYWVWVGFFIGVGEASLSSDASCLWFSQPPRELIGAIGGNHAWKTIEVPSREMQNQEPNRDARTKPELWWPKFPQNFPTNCRQIVIEGTTIHHLKPYLTEETNTPAPLTKCNMLTVFVSISWIWPPHSNSGKVIL